MPFGMRRRGFRYFAKELIRVWEAPLKRFHHLFPDFITTRADGRTQHGKQALRLRTIHTAHLPHSLFQDARQRAAPPGMNCRHSSTFRVHQQHGQAIRGSYRQQDTSLIGQQRIARGLRNAKPFRHSIPAEAVLEFAGRSTKNLIDTGGMDLPERSQREVFRAKLLEEKLPIFPHPRARLTRVNPRFSPEDGPRLTPPRRVLNAWTNQEQRLMSGCSSQASPPRETICKAK